MSKGQYKFGSWTFDAATGDLHDGQKTQRLEPKVAKLLDYFLINQERVITREELIDAVWETRQVSDDAIQRCVSILRQILTPGDKQAFIETLIRRGYIAHFPPDETVAQNLAPGKTGYLRRWWAPIALATALVIAIFVGLQMNEGSYNPAIEGNAESSLQPTTLAVLPFTVTGSSAESEFLAKGLHDDLLTALTKFQSVRVISAASVREYRGAERNLKSIAEQLGAEVLLEGALQAVGSTVRFNAQLIDAKTDAHLWAEVYERDLSSTSLFKLQSEIAKGIAAALNAQLTSETREQLSLVPTNNMQAYRAYHRALRVIEEKSRENFEYRQALKEAIELDPNYRDALAALTRNYAFLYFGGYGEHYAAESEATLVQLEAIDADSPEFFRGQAAYIYYVIKDYDTASEIVARAVDLNPSDTDLLNLMASIERRRGNVSALPEIYRRVRMLDPRNPKIQSALISSLIVLHQYEQALAESELVTIYDYRTAYYRSLLRFKQHRDFDQFDAEMDSICARFDEVPCGWEASVAVRNNVATRLKFATKPEGQGELFLGKFDFTKLLAYWVLEDETLDKQSQYARMQLLEEQNNKGEWDQLIAYLIAAVVAGIEGDRAEAERYVHSFFVLTNNDWTNRVYYRHYACRILALIEATDSAVSCIREGLDEPSLVMPFFEPYLPYYDAIRAQTSFVNLLAQIDRKEGVELASDDSVEALAR